MINTAKKYQKTITKPAFKAWFGDWEGNPSSASKAVDEDGVPMVLYHGSAEQNLTEIATYECGQPCGAYFSSDEKVARSYCYSNRDDSYLYTCFLNLRNPKMINCNSLNYTQIDEVLGIKLIFKSRNRYYHEYFHSVQEAELFIETIAKNEALSSIEIQENHEDILYIPTVVKSSYPWYDGVIFKDVYDIGYDIKKEDMKPSTVVVVYEPEQIKSAVSNSGLYCNNIQNIYQ